MKYETVQRENWLHDTKVCYLRLQYFLSICEPLVCTLSFINPGEDVSCRSLWLRLSRTLIYDVQILETRNPASNGT